MRMGRIMKRVVMAGAVGGVLMLAPWTRVAAVAVPGYAISGATIVTVSGATIPSGTVVIRNGVIEQVSPDATAPAGVETIDGKGLTVYPGLVDLDARVGLDAPSIEQPKNPESREVSERWKRDQLLHAQWMAADQLQADSPDLMTLAGMGVTNALVVPAGDGVAGESAFIDVVGPELDPQYGRVAVMPSGRMVLRTPVALHVAFPASRGFSGVYPVSLMGGIAFIRQAFLDARRYEQALKEKDAAGDRPAYDPSLAAMARALEQQTPIVFEAASAREIRRVLRFAKDFSIDPVVLAGYGATETADELKTAGARVIVKMDYPERAKWLAPDADEPLSDVEARANARKAAAALAAAGVPFGFGSAGLKDVKSFVPNVRAAVDQGGLSREAAIRALTLDAAALAGLGSRLGAVERGRIANLVVTDGDLLGAKTKVKYVFVEGRRILLP
jgi:imidazolonepropionase-like amidohydrolase